MLKSAGVDADHLSPVAAGRFVYDHAGQRVLKAVGRGTAPEDVTLYLAADTEVRHGWQLTKYVFAGSERLAKLVDGNGTDDVLPGFHSYHFYYHADMLHTASVVTDDAGGLVERRNYLPFGPPEADASQAPYASYREPYGFTGKELDEDFGLQYFGARYYAPGLGRWVSADPLFLLNPERGLDHPLKLNLYVYVDGRVLILRDPNGQDAHEVVGQVATCTIVAHKSAAQTLLEVPLASTLHPVEVFKSSAKATLFAPAAIVDLAADIFRRIRRAPAGTKLEAVCEIYGEVTGPLALDAVVSPAARPARSSQKAPALRPGPSTRAARGAHGNSRLSTRAQHGYEIVDTTTGEVVKTGVSGGRRTATGGSARANSQANRWNREAGQPGRYEPRVVQEVPAGPGARQQILQWEADNAARLREAGQLRDPTKHVRP